MSYDEPVCAGVHLNALINEMDDFFTGGLENGLDYHDGILVAFAFCRLHPEYLAAIIAEDIDMTGYKRNDEEVDAFVEQFVKEHPI